VNSQALGRWGETLAADHLERRGWTILERNFRFGRSEIDLVAERKGIVAFVEVKTRSTARLGHPLRAVIGSKRRAIEQVAAGWIETNRRQDDEYRYDAIAVYRAGAHGGLLEHVENAWGN